MKEHQRIKLLIMCNNQFIEYKLRDSFASQILTHQIKFASSIIISQHQLKQYKPHCVIIDLSILNSEMKLLIDEIRILNIPMILISYPNNRSQTLAMMQFGKIASIDVTGLKKSSINHLLDKLMAENIYNNIPHYQPTVFSHLNEVLKMDNQFLSDVQTKIIHARDNSLTLSLLLIELTDFNHIKFMLGNKISTFITRVMISRIRNEIHRDDHIYFLGDNKFAVLSEDLKAITDIANRIVELSTKPLSLAGNRILLKINIGIAHYPSDCLDASTLIKHADIALYLAKQTEDNSFQFFNNQHHQNNLQRKKIIKDLEDALQAKDFYLRYQPIFSLETKKIIGFESLLRWNHPTLDIIGPKEFIPIADESGVMIKIGDWIIEEATHDFLNWFIASDIPQKLLIKLADSQLQEANLINMINNILQKTGLSKTALTFEVNQNQIANHVKLVEQQLIALHDYGVQTCIEGVTDLSYVRNYTKQGLIKFLKLDLSMASQCESNPEVKNAVDGIIKHCITNGIKLIATGIENERDLENMQKLGCQFGQGYYLCNPLRAIDITYMMQYKWNLAIKK